MHMTVDNGRRASTSFAYLKPVRSRKNLRVITGTLVTKVLLQGNRATGVAYEKECNMFELLARAEVILSAGSIGSPAFAQRSGIGSPMSLEDAGVSVVHPLEGVGQNLQDHLEVYFQYRCRERFP